MENSRIQFLSDEVAIGKIVDTIRQAKHGEAPFVLILGAGFSHGLVPTASEIVSDYIPQRFKPRDKQDVQTVDITIRHADGRTEVRRCQATVEDKKRIISREFWQKFFDENKTGVLKDIPSLQVFLDDYRQQYKYAFAKESVGALGNPADARAFIRTLIRPDRPQLNEAHFILASILGAQPSKTEKKENQFKYQAAFSRCILTTNFDPFLQVALQAVNRLYFMSDTPHLESEDLTDEQTDAIHLVYVHGSVHRHRQDNNNEDIDEKKIIAEDLVPVLEKHGIIIIGYNGWDDAIVKALAKCKNFSSHGLYWVDLQPDPQTDGAFGPDIPAILRKPNASYVQAKAGPFMNRLHNRLVKGLPRLLDNPFAQLREMLTVIDFGELEVLETKTNVASDEIILIPQNHLGKPTFKEFKTLTLQSLRTAEAFFTNNRNSASLAKHARLALNMGKSAETIEFCNKGLARKLSSSEQAAFYELRAYALMQNDKLDEAISDLNRIIEESSEVPTDIRMRCLRWRAAILFEKGEYDRVVIDITNLIKSRTDPDRDHQVNLHLWRARARERAGGKNNMCRAIVDYTYILKLPYSSPPNEKERAFYCRAIDWAEVKQYERAIADYTKVIISLPAKYGDTRADSGIRELVDLVARSLCNRGYTYDWQGNKKDAMADFQRVIESLPGVSDERKSDALDCRGWAFYTQDNFPNFLRDIENALQKYPLAHHAMYHLGLAFLANGRDAEAFDAYTRAAKEHPSFAESYGLIGLRDAVGRWLTPERAKPCIDLLESVKKDATFND